MAIRGVASRLKSGWMPNRATSHAVAVVPMLAPHDHAYSLAEVEQTGVGESDDHDGHGAG